MKTIKYGFFYICIILSLMTLYDCSTIIRILFQYTIFDLRYFLFILIQFYWMSILFDILYQYIVLYQYIRIRLTQQKCFIIFFKRYCLYCLFYLVMHIPIINIAYPLIFLNLLIHTLCFIIALSFKKIWNYSYVLLIMSNVIIHLFITI